MEKSYGWSVYDNKPRRARIRNKFNDQRQSRVIQLKGAGTDNGYVLRNEDGSPWHNSEQFTIQWSMEYEEDFVVYLDVETTAGHRYIYYTLDDYDDLGSGEYVHHGFGALAKGGQWRTFTRDLQSDLEEAQPGVSILEVSGFLLRGSGEVYNIQLKSKLASEKVHNKMVRRCYERCHYEKIYLFFFFSSCCTGFYNFSGSKFLRR